MGMTVVGIDPGTRHLGWGVVRVEGTRITHVAHGVVHAPIDAALEERLLVIDDALSEVLDEARPVEAAVESIFFAKDPQAAAKLGHARGVVLLRLRRAGLSVAEYAPAHIKRALVGRGQAEKHQVQQVITVLLGLATPPPTDASDALAVAVAHARVMALPPAVRAAMAQARELKKAIARRAARSRAG